MNRPAWSQVLRAAGDAGRARIEEAGAGGTFGLLEAQLKAVVDLFGGVAPDPVEVPVLSPFGGLNQTPDAHFAVVARNGACVTREVAAAAAARSNAWEQLKMLATDLNGCLDGSASVVTWPLAQKRAKELLDLMSHSEMGVGPKP